MKKYFFTLSAFVFLMSIVIVSCKKEDNTPPPKTKTENISSNSWKFSSAVAAGSDISNNPSISCIKDDAVTFQSNGNGTVTEGLIVCNPTTAGNFTWSFQNNETQLMMSAGLFPGGSGLFNLVSLNETTLVVSQDVIIPPSTTSILVTATYVH